MQRRVIKVCCALLGLALSGCTGWSVTDPAGSLGRWKPQPAVQPILQTLSAAEELETLEYEEFGYAEDPTPEDLQAITENYAVGPGDVINVQIFELLNPDTPYGEQLVVDDLGFITIQHVGQIKADGLTSDELTERIKELLYPNVLRDPRVTVTVLSRIQRTFSIIGQVYYSGTHPITKADYRLLEALAQGYGITGTNIPYVYVIRQPAEAELLEPSEAEDKEPTLAAPTGQQPAKAGPPELSPEEELEELLKGIPAESAGNDDGSKMSNVLHFSDVSAGSRSSRQAGRAEDKDFDWSAATSAKKLPFAGRVIRIPLLELYAGNASYNIVIRNNDVIHVPRIEIGFYYMMGNINRAGTYQIGTVPVTLTRAIAAAGSLNVVAEPTKVDITRRIGKHKQEIVQVDLAKIFAGVQPDYYIKRDDIINVGTSPVSPWLAILRNGFRATYGFGFVYDRNYADRDAFRPFELPNLLFW